MDGTREGSWHYPEQCGYSFDTWIYADSQTDSITIQSGEEFEIQYTCSASNAICPADVTISVTGDGYGYFSGSSNC